MRPRRTRRARTPMPCARTVASRRGAGPVIRSGLAGGRPGGRGGRGARGGQEALDLVDRDLLLLALQGGLPQALALEDVLDGGVGVLANDDEARLGRRALQAAGRVHGVAQDRVLLL